MKKQLSVPEWHVLAQNGTGVPMRILIHGNSMFPLIRMDRDYVTIMALTDDIRIGDIVLFSEPGRARYVLHRVWCIEKSRVFTWGDNCSAPDGWLPLDTIWGKVTLIERGKKQIHPDPVKGFRWAQVWHCLGRGYRLGRRILAGIMRRINRII